MGQTKYFLLGSYLISNTVKTAWWLVDFVSKVVVELRYEVDDEKSENIEMATLIIGIRSREKVHV